MTGTGNELLSSLAELARSVDEEFQAIRSRQAPRMQCRMGCNDCCRARLSITRVEAAYLGRGLARLSEEKRRELRRRASDETREMCPALDPDGRCALYEWRPLICRSHGAPLRRRREVPLVHPPIIDICELNFVDMEFDSLPAEDVLELTPRDAALSRLEREFCAREGLPLGEREGIAAILRSTAGP